MSKTIFITGVTGNQGSSVASVFLQSSSWRVRGLTRDPSSPKSRELASRGVALIKGDLTDVASVASAAQGAHVIFGNTRFNAALFNESPEYKAHAKPGQSPRDFHFEEEVAKGRNIADAAAAVPELELFVWSAASEPGKWSGGKFSGLASFETKGAIWRYIQEAHPELAKKTSILYLGMYTTNWRWGATSFNWTKKEDGSLVLRLPGKGPYPLPFVLPSDTGYYVEALTKVAPGKKLVGCSARLSWAEFVKLWSSIVGIKAVYEHCSIEEHSLAAPGPHSEMVGQMYEYAAQFGYWGEGDPAVVFPENLGVEINQTPLDNVIKSEDWPRLLELL